MANYNLQVNLGSNFKPYTFQDLVAPLLLYKEDYLKMQDKLEKYSEKLGEIALPEDSAYSALLQQYKSDLQSLVDSFYNQGLNYKTGAAANMMFRRAGTELTPIQKGIERYNAAVDKVTLLRMQDPTAFVTTDMSLDRFIGNAANPLIEAISGKQVALDIALQTKAHLEQIEKEGKISNPKTGWAISMLKQNKISLEQLQLMINDPNSLLGGASEEIQGIINSLSTVYNNTRKRYGYDNLSDSGKQNLDYYMSLGASTGMTVPELKLGTDEPALLLESLAIQRERLALDERHHRDEMALRWHLANLYGLNNGGVPSTLEDLIYNKLLNTNVDPTAVVVGSGKSAVSGAFTLDKTTGRPVQVQLGEDGHYYDSNGTDYGDASSLRSYHSRIRDTIKQQLNPSKDKKSGNRSSSKGERWAYSPTGMRDGSISQWKNRLDIRVDYDGKSKISTTSVRVYDSNGHEIYPYENGNNFNRVYWETIRSLAGRKGESALESETKGALNRYKILKKNGELPSISNGNNTSTKGNSPAGGSGF